MIGFMNAAEFFGVESRVGKKFGRQHDNGTLSLDWGDEPESSNRVGFIPSPAIEKGRFAREG